MILSEAQRAFTRFVARFILHAYETGYELTLGEAWRSPEEAQRLATAGLGILDSPHRRRLAIDLNLFKGGVYQTDTEAWRPLGEWWESLDPHCKWGGRFPRGDGNHLEYRL